METVRYKLFLLSLALILVSSSGYAADPNLTTVSSSAAEFRFVYSFASDLEAVGVSGDLTALERIVQVAVPPDAEVSLVSAIGFDPITDLSATRHLVLTSVLSELASLGATTEVRGRRIAGVKISPFENGTVFERVEVALSFERTNLNAALSRAVDSQFDRIWAASLANYETAVNWPLIDRRSGAKAALVAESAAILAATDQWYHVSVGQSGLTRITGAQLTSAGISITGLASDDIRLFTAGGLPLPLENSVARPQLQEVALLVLDGGDGVFDNSDQIIFYGEAPDRWTYSNGGAPVFVNNTYTDENVYWLAVTGTFIGQPSRMNEVSGIPTGSAPQIISNCWHHRHYEQDRMISTEPDGHIWDFFNWFWSDSTNLSLFLSSPGVVPGSTARVHLQGRSNRNIGLNVNGGSTVRLGCNSLFCTFETSGLTSSGQNRFDISLPPQTATVPAYLDYVELFYYGSITPVQNQVEFSLDSLAGTVEVEVIDAFNSTPIVFDLSDPVSPVIISDYRRTGGLLSFETEAASGGPNRYYVTVLNEAVAPLSIRPVQFTDLWRGYSQADMIIVTSRALEPFLAEYLAYRQGTGVSIAVATVEDITACFGYGLNDPTAIRDYLKFAYENYPAPAPAIALFVGDASYDFMDHLGTGVKNHVPSYIRPGDRTYSDDNFVYFGDYGVLDANRDRLFDMMTARWPVRTATEINTIVGKIKAYESSAGFGRWRTRITLVADDEHTDSRDDEIFHTTQTETLEKLYVPRYLSRNKIYLWEYPFVNREKPEVNEAIVDAFNDGSLIINYVGHGNPDVWAHEHVFERTGDLPRLHNADRLPLVYAASCDIGFFDDPSREGMAEDLLAMPGGGAVGVISATRLVYAFDNAQFNRAVYSILFDDPGLTVCEALFAAKVQRQYPNPLDSIPRPVDNDRAYNFLGDPLMVLGIPRLRVEFIEQPDSLKALEVSRVRGRLVDFSGTPYLGSGQAEITVYDSDRERSYRLPDQITGTDYYVPGPTIFRGSATVVNGEFDFRFMTPLDVGYRGNSARISVYAALGDTDGVGLVDSLPVSESQAASDDRDGPLISSGVSGRGSFESGDLLQSSESLEIRIADASGINLVGGVGHGITLTVDNEVEEAVNLNDRFVFDENDYTAGRLVYPLTGISPGRHDFKIKAWDNANNVSVLEFVAEIANSDRLVIRELLNYPNPMEDHTTFYFGLSHPVEEIKLEIYTLSGKTIWHTSRYHLEADYYPNGSEEFVWNGRDGAGDRVAAGVYIYRVSAVPTLSGEPAQEFGKVIVSY